MLKYVARITAALAIGLIFSLWIIQNNQSVKNLVSSQIINFVENDWNAHIDVASIKINFFTCSMLLNSGKITPADTRDFVWYFEQCKVSFSPLTLLFKKKMVLSIALNNMKIQTSYANGESDLINHFADIFKSKTPTLDITADLFNINNAELLVKLPTHGNRLIEILIPGSLDIKKDENRLWSGLVRLEDATIKHNEKTLFHSISGTSDFWQNKKTGAFEINMLLKSSCKLLNPLETYACSFNIKETLTQLSFIDAKKNLSFSATFLPHDQIGIEGSIPLQFLSNCINFIGTGNTQIPSFMPTVTGTCHTNLIITNNNSGISPTGTIDLHNISCHKGSVDHIGLTLSSTIDNKIHSTVNIIQSPQKHLAGALLWNWESKQGSLSLTNTIPLSASIAPQSGITPLMIKPHDLEAAITFDHQGTLQGTYRCILTNQTTEKQHSYKGALMLSNNTIGVNGVSAKGDYLLKASLTPHPHITMWRYNVGNRTLANVATSLDKPMHLKGFVRWACIRAFLDHDIRRFVFNNQCSFMVDIDQSNSEDINGSIKLAGGKFFIPDFHNLINSITARISLNFAEKSIFIDNACIGMSKGKIVCPRAHIAFANDYTLKMIHAPLGIHDLFINWKHDFYGFIYGNVLLNKLPHALTKLSGSIILKKSILRDAFLNKQYAPTMHGPTVNSFPLHSLPLELDITLDTEQPLKAKTKSLQTTASVSLAVKTRQTQDLYITPHVSGVVHLNDGFIKFFNKKLFISYGKIQFISHNLDDPLIDLMAKNRIGKYLISLQATGSIQKPTILLESTPDLTEEQIIGLLMTGSENVTLQADLPTMLLQNLDSFIFNSNKNSKSASWVEALSKTFKYVQITPDFTDDTNPKLKGSISINVTDQLRAHIQKNLDLEKDFSAQLEYLVSDDINLKVIRDQRGELGSEIEMRLKLG